MFLVGTLGCGAIGAGIAINRDEPVGGYFVAGVLFGVFAWACLVIKSCAS